MRLLLQAASAPAAAPLPAPAPPQHFYPPPPRIRPEDVCEKTGVNKCGASSVAAALWRCSDGGAGEQALHLFLSTYAAPAGWICTLVASLLAFGQARSEAAARAASSRSTRLTPPAAARFSCT